MYFRLPLMHIYRIENNIHKKKTQQIEFSNGQELCFVTNIVLSRQIRNQVIHEYPRIYILNITLTINKKLFCTIKFNDEKKPTKKIKTKSQM